VLRAGVLGIAEGYFHDGIFWDARGVHARKHARYVCMQKHAEVRWLSSVPSCSSVCVSEMAGRKAPYSREKKMELKASEMYLVLRIIYGYDL
jgi:hypothetical protein